MAKNIFVVGLDDINLQMLKTVRDAEHYAFHNLLRYKDIVNPESYPMEKLVNDARRELDEFNDEVDAIIGHWDFPTTLMLPILRRERGLNGPSLESVLKCENKYWSRLEQSRAVPESTPGFQAVDPRSDNAVSGLELEYPFWLKPVIAFSSYLGFRIDNEAAFRSALEIIRSNIDKFAEPFEYLAGFSDTAPEIREFHGGFCIAEELIKGRLCTLEGYVFRGEPVVYGIVDSWRGPNKVSFERYEMPSVLPEGVQKRMIDYAERVVGHIGLDNSPFNMECFWDEETDTVKILEINPRISKSHSPIFYMTEGASHHEVAIDIALGRRPQFPSGKGRYKVAGKFMPRTYQDTTITRAPTQQDIDRVRERFPGSMINVYAPAGARLSELPNQDSYSFEFADVFMGADSHDQLMANFTEAMKMLDFRFSDAVETNYE